MGVEVQRSPPGTAGREGALAARVRFRWGFLGEGFPGVKSRGWSCEPGKCRGREGRQEEDRTGDWQGAGTSEQYLECHFHSPSLETRVTFQDLAKMAPP